MKIPIKCKSLGEEETYEAEKTKKKIIDVEFGQKGNFKKKKSPQTLEVVGKVSNMKLYNTQ